MAEEQLRIIKNTTQKTGIFFDSQNTKMPFCALKRYQINLKGNNNLICNNFTQIIVNHPLDHMHHINNPNSYVTCQPNLPLELNGKMKRHIPTIAKQSELLCQESKTMILVKAQNNKLALSNRRSILPTQDCRKKERPQSIRVFPNQNGVGRKRQQIIQSSKVDQLKNDNKENKQKQNKNVENDKYTQKNEQHVSGIEYLMGRSCPLKKDGKVHLREWPGELKQQNCRRKYLREPEPQMASDKPQKQKQISQIPHQSTQLRIFQDIHSVPFRNEQPLAVGIKKIQKGLFNRGQDLGFEQQKKVKLSEGKMRQVVGCEYGRVPQQPPKKRCDWAISNITLG